MTDNATERMDRLERALIYLAANHPEDKIYPHVVRVIAGNEQQQKMLDQLMVGSDIVGDHFDAREFLETLMIRSPPNAAATVLPVGRRLLSYPEWPSWDVNYIVDYCVRRVEVVGAIDAYRTDEIDPAADLLAGMVVELVFRLEGGLVEPLS